MIELRKVSKTFVSARGATTALARVDLAIMDGELVCLVGPSGCGKTTLLNLIAGLDQPDAGEIRVDGRRIRGPGPDRVVLFQDAALFPWLTVAQNVEFGTREIGLGRKARGARTRHFLARVGLSAFADANVHELSGGMRQRVALARALALDPPVLLMDEPFGALDPRTREVLQDEVVDLWQATGKTIIFVTHDMAEAVRLASRVVLLKARPARVSLSLELESRLGRPRGIDQPSVIALAGSLREGLDDAQELERPRRDGDGPGQTPRPGARRGGAGAVGGAAAPPPGLDAHD